MSDLLATERDAQARTEYLNRAPRASERQPGVWGGAFNDIIPGFERGVERLAETITSRSADSMEWARNNPVAAESFIQSEMGAGDLNWPSRARELPRIAEPDPIETAVRRQSEAATERRQALRPDPSRVGAAGTILGGLAEVSVPLVAGAAAGGTPGAAVAFGATQGEATSQDLMAEGVDEYTARTAGNIEGFTAAASVFFPASLASARSTFLARVLERSASGAALNVGIGAASRESVGGYLRAQGYEQQASRYRALDAQSVIADAVLGVAFGSMGPRAEGRDAPRDVPTPDETDAALDIATERRARVDAAPGIPLDLQAEAKHAEAMRTAERQAEEGEPIDVGTFSEEDMAGFARHPEDFEAEQRIEAAIRETLEAEGYSDLQADVERLQAQARAAGIDDALFSRGAVRTPDEAREFVANAVARNHESYFFRTPDDTVVVGLPAVLDRRASVLPDWTFQSAARANQGDATKSYWYRERSGPPSAAETARILRRVVASVRDHAEAFGPRSYRFQTLESGMGRIYERLFREAPIDGYELRALGGDEYVLARQPGAPAPTGKSLAQYGEDGTSLPLMSAGARPGFSTTQTLTSQLSREFGSDWEALSRSGKVEVVQSTKDLPVSDLENVRGVKGLHLRGSGKTYLVANNIRPDQAKGVLLHEIGVHHGMPEMLGKRGFNAVMRAVDRLVEEGQPDAVAARDAAEMYAGRDDLIPEETVAYLIEYAPDLPLTQSILSQIRQWLVKTFGSTFGLRLTVDDIRALALASLRRVAEQGRRDIGDWTPLPETVFHGSPHSFEQFDSGKIGTGEGGQAFGYGLYVAENKAVAEAYRDLFAGKLFGGEITEAHLYEARLDGRVEDFIDLDAPIAQQPKRVQEFMAQLYGMSVAEVRKKGLTAVIVGPEEAARAQQAGFLGLRYLDEQSSARGEGTRNYVVFDASKLNVLTRDGEPVSNAMVMLASKEGYRGQDTGEAREWLDAKAKGLPMDEASRMQRAREMGFDTPAYHVTSAEFDQFRPNPFRGASFFARTPEDAVRGASAGARDHTGVGGEGARTIPALVPSREIHGFRYTDAEEAFVRSLPERFGDDEFDAIRARIDQHHPLSVYGVYDSVEVTPGVFEYVRKPLPQLDWETAARTDRDVYGHQWPHYGKGSERFSSDRARELGFSGFAHQDEGGLSIGMIDPTRVRSRFAAFDPARSGESDLLASRGTGRPVSVTPVSLTTAKGQARIAELGRKGLSHRVIAKTVGATEAYVKGVLRREGITTENVGGATARSLRNNEILRRLREGKSQNAVVAEWNKTPELVSEHGKLSQSIVAGVVLRWSDRAEPAPPPASNEAQTRFGISPERARAMSARRDILYSRAGRETTSRRINLPAPFMGAMDVTVNPRERDIARMLSDQRRMGSEESVRWGLDENGDLIVWDGNKTTHGMVEGESGSFKETGEFNDVMEVRPVLSRVAKEQRDADAYHDLEPVQQAMVDDPTMTVPTEEGMVPARDAMELVNIEAKSARELSKGFPAAMKCAIKHGGMLAAANRNMARDIVVGQGLGLAASIPVGYGVAMGARAAADYETAPLNQFNRQRARMEEGMALDRQGYLDAPVVPYGEEQGGPRRVDWNAPAGDAGWDRNPATGNPFRSIPADAPSPVETVENDPFAGLGGPEDE